MDDQVVRSAVMSTTARWQVNITLWGNLLISQEKVYRGWVASRGGVTRRTVEDHEKIVWRSQFKSAGANNLLVVEWVSGQLRRLCPGDRLDGVQITVRLIGE